MTTEQRHHAPMRARTIYWGTQLLAWALLVSVIGLYLYQDRSLSPDQIKVLVLFYFTGLGISHWFRHVIIRNGWLERDLGFVLPRLSLVALLLSIVAFLLMAVVHDSFFPGYAPLLVADPLAILLNTINWTVLLFIWSLGYFAYVYFIRSRREEIRNLRLERTDCALHHSVRIESRTAAFVLSIGNSEQNHRRNAQRFHLKRFLHQQVDGHSGLPGHRGNGFAAALALRDKRWVNEVVRRQARFTNHAPERLTFPQTTQALNRKCHGPLTSSVNSSERPPGRAPKSCRPIVRLSSRPSDGDGSAPSGRSHPAASYVLRS